MLDIAISEQPSRAGSVRLWEASMRAWIFLFLLLLGFEVWAQTAFHMTFLLNPLNVASIAVFAIGPILLALGQTFVVISGGLISPC